MASAEVLNFDSLLQKISDEQPAGVSLRSDDELSMLFFEIRDKRRAASDSERQTAEYTMLDAEERELEPRPTPPDWEAVLECSTRILTQHSKDLWVSAWMAEAAARLHGFAGLRDGIRLIRELCERFWDGVHPRPDEDEGLNTTLSQVAALNELLPEPVYGIPLTPPTGNYGELTGADYNFAAKLESRPEEKSKRQAEGAITIESFDQAANEGSPEFFRNLVEDLEAAERELRQMEEVVEQRCDEAEFDDPPSVSRISSALSECLHWVRSFAKNHISSSDSGDAEAVDGPETADTTNASGTAVAAGEIRSREDAFRALSKIADFFRRTEPHSPTSYALEQVVRWGGMSLPQLLNALIKDDSVRNDLFRRTGIEDGQD